ncbi:aspartate kinase [Campylobacter canadensis]|uniref:Aspartokinase n=1 Tax=Campylobacter canadensis TaxID=449520 RepID=A0ABS7WSX6_9BACT|nr:aspartate kinase [Campylobacter canadensis]MBZ7987857.1 aspartate kinase [Campylobacter canadensis]MBZ7994403.1 aspartate kinase [Campylobacter canadensis]MBZ7996099.1 aspartate kinase [Campylobacter canadensis]MBZ7998871.1 aspartate kinase [Campylobacter canadensis]MBZ7999735.1 aspartate kinase [Campylobacter canadensis]
MIVVQKYGGTSVGNLERIENVANRIIKSKQLYKDLVVIVSAMSGRTNELIERAQYYSDNPSKLEMDKLLNCGEKESAALLAIALISKGYDAVSLSGKDALMLTSSDYTNAKIISIDNSRVKQELQKGKIVIIAGFQGADENGFETTLGRGGSDLSAVAFAGALNADLCEIYTDVDGVYTTDPRIEPKAKKLDKISYEEMLELASLGAKVLQNRSVELAKKLNVKLVTRSSFNENEGTIITSEEKMEQALVSGIALDKNQARITLRQVEDKPGIAAKVFTTLAKNEINVDMIIQNVGRDGTTNIGFTVPQSSLNQALDAMRELLGANALIESDSEIVKVSVVGVGMKTHAGVASSAFLALANEGINIQMISTSEIKISLIVASKYAELAVRTLHKTYNLDK